MKVGDLIQYKHNERDRGIVVDIDFSRRIDAPLLVLWSPDVPARLGLDRSTWWVAINSVEVASEG